MQTRIKPEFSKSFLDHLGKWEFLKEISAIELFSLLIHYSCLTARIGDISKKEWLETCGKVWDFANSINN